MVFVISINPVEQLGQQDLLKLNKNFIDVSETFTLDQLTKYKKQGFYSLTISSISIGFLRDCLSVAPD